MRLVEFLIELLDAHGQTLQRLAAFFGEDKFLEMIEEMPDLPDLGENEPAKPVLRADALESFPGGSASPYQELEGAVQEMKIPAVLEFYLWAYPHYRAFIESPVDLNSRIVSRSQGGTTDAGVALVEEAITQAQEWVKRLPIPPAVAPQAERAAHVPWLRFRTNVLKRIGRRPLGPVY